MDGAEMQEIISPLSSCLIGTASSLYAASRATPGRNWWRSVVRKASMAP
jgi:hypothetical protein